MTIRQHIIAYTAIIYRFLSNIICCKQTIFCAAVHFKRDSKLPISFSDYIRLISKLKYCKDLSKSACSTSVPFRSTFWPVARDYWSIFSGEWAMWFSTNDTLGRFQCIFNVNCNGSASKINSFHFEMHFITPSFKKIQFKMRHFP